MPFRETGIESTPEDLEAVELGVPPHEVRDATRGVEVRGRSAAADHPWVHASARPVIGHANELNLRVHMHVAEQPAEVSACVEEYGRTPIALLETEGLLSERFTAVHAIHVTPKAMSAFAKTGAMVCACPTTERNLGDGVVPVDAYFEAGVRVALGCAVVPAVMRRP